MYKVVSHKEICGLSDRQIDACLNRLQEYIDIGWNHKRIHLKECPLCYVFIGVEEDRPLNTYFDWLSVSIHTACEFCPLSKNKAESCCDFIPRARRLWIGRKYIGSRFVARCHARWLRRKYIKAGLYIDFIKMVAEEGEWI